MEVTLHPESEYEIKIEDDPDFAKLVEHRTKISSTFKPIGAKRGGGDDWDAPLDLRVNRPFALDLRKLWELGGQPVPSEVQAMLGTQTPVLIHHVVTPFPMDGRIPGGVWGLGYEFVNESAEANTIAVLPSDEMLKIASIGQQAEVGLNLSGGVGIPDTRIGGIANAPEIQLAGAQLKASADQTFQFSLKMSLSLRKVVGAPVGKGGALWKMYRQDEPLDRPHTLMQTVMVAQGTREISCTIKTWAKQAGFLGTRLGAKFWPYEDQEFVVSLDNEAVMPAIG